MLSGLGALGPIELWIEVEGRELLDDGVWISLVRESSGEEALEWSLPGGIVAPGPFGLLIEVKATRPLDEVDEASVKGGLGPLGSSGSLTEIRATGLLDDGTGWVIVFVLAGGDDPVKDTPWAPPGPLFLPAPTSVVTTVTVCEHRPRNGTICRPAVEITVAEHCAMTIVVSAPVLPFCGDATREFELLERALELVE